MSLVEELRKTAELLEEAYLMARERMERDFPEPLLVKDPNGRYVLLDALTALAAARSALLAEERS